MRNKNIFKKVTAISVCAAVLLSMTACGGNNSSSGTPASSAQGTSADSSTANSADSASTTSETSKDGETSNASSTDSANSAANSAAESGAASEVTSIPEDTTYTLGGELTPAMIARSRYNEGNKVRLAKVIKKLQANEEVTVAYIGGSITNGTSAGDDLCYAKLTTNWLQEKFPNAKINYVNAGIGGTDSIFGIARVDNDVISKNPDLVFTEFAVNDTADFADIYKETYSALIRKLWDSANSPAIVAIGMTQEDGTSVGDIHGEIAKNFDIPFISYKDVILNVIEKNYITWKDISDDDIHPNVAGHALLSNLITNYLQSVIDDVDNISGDESDLSADTAGTDLAALKFTTAKNLTLKTPGCFTMQESPYASYGVHYLVKNKEGTFADTDAAEIEFEGTEVRLLFVMQGKYGAKADIFVDDELKTTIDSTSPDGKHSHVEIAKIADGLAEGKHTLKIAPKSQEGTANFYISGIAVK